MTMSIPEADAQLTAAGQMFEVAEADVRGVATKVWKNCPAWLGDILLMSRGHGDQTFLVYEDDRMTYEEHFRACAHLAGILRSRFGVVEGDRVAIAMRNFPEWSVAFWAAAAAGAVVVPLNAWWTGEELEYGLADSGTKVLFADLERAERIAAYAGGTRGAGAGKRLRVEATIVVRRGDPSGGDVGDLPAGTLDWAAVLGEVPADVSLPAVRIGTDDDATIFYTSGTTGRPKGALGTHRNICTNPLSLIYVGVRAARRAGIDPAAAAAAGPGAYLVSVPFFHATGCHSILVTNLMVGGKLVLMYRWDAGRALELIERESITNFGGVPAMVMQVLDHPDFARRNTSSVRAVGYGGAPAPPDLVRRIEEHFGPVPTSNGYGLTETSSLSTMNTGADYVRKPDSVGPPVPVVTVKVVDPVRDNVELPVGEIGELWIKGPNVVKGYWRKPEATAETFSEGWLHTADVASIDHEGFVYIVDRAKDMLIRGGENIYSVEIESVLYDHPAVADAAVIGIPHPVLGEEVGAVVQLRPGMAATEEELRQHVAARLAAFKVPVRIWFRDEPLSRNPAGKILKRELRDELLGPASGG
jgi:long-chain acyl-CoA synthetase